jgi:hypothetical protein
MLSPSKYEDWRPQRPIRLTLPLRGAFSPPHPNPLPSGARERTPAFPRPKFGERVGVRGCQLLAYKLVRCDPCAGVRV